MYKVFFNRVVFYLLTKNELSEIQNDELNTGNQLNSLDELSPERWQESETNGVFFFLSNDIESDWKKVKNVFKIVEAAGGIVENSSGKILTIFRNQKWDLPKGKREKGESIIECAVREVEEETGVAVSSNEEKIFRTTYHVYYHKNKWVLKPTFWIAMKSDNLPELTPQTEEGIEAVEWMTIEKIRTQFFNNTYPALLDLMCIYLGENVS